MYTESPWLMHSLRTAVAPDQALGREGQLIHTGKDTIVVRHVIKKVDTNALI